MRAGCLGNECWLLGALSLRWCAALLCSVLAARHASGPKVGWKLLSQSSSVVVVVPARVVRCWREASRLILSQTRRRSTHSVKFCSVLIPIPSEQTAQPRVSDPSPFIPSFVVRPSFVRPSLFPPLPEPAAASPPAPVLRATSAFGNWKSSVARPRTGPVQHTSSSTRFL